MKALTIGDFDLTVPFAGLLLGVSVLAIFRPPPAVAVEPRGAATVLPSQGRGSITGVVVDAHGDAIPGARVTVLLDDGVVLSEAVSGIGDESLGLGEFRIDQLPRGTYSLHASVDQSRSSAQIARVPVSSWENTRVRIVLDLGY